MTATPASQNGERRPLLPRTRDVLAEQFRTIGSALRIPMLLAAALAVLGTIAVIVRPSAVRAM